MDCDECGFRFEGIAAGELSGQLRDVSARYGQRLEGLRAEALGHHPTPAVWSALEYACHVRDVLFNIRDRILLALVEDDPAFPLMYREEWVRLARYAEEDPSRVAAGIGVGGNLLAFLLDGVASDQLTRTGIYGGTQRDVLWMGRQALHEVRHHLGDIDTCLMSATAEGH